MTEQLTDLDRQWLESFGWSAEPVDTCWLDCDRDGHLKTWHHSEIVLCLPHARVLENGKLRQSYSGAPLPGDSAATHWPWRRQEVQLVSVV